MFWSLVSFCTLGPKARLLNLLQQLKTRGFRLIAVCIPLSDDKHQMVRDSSKKAVASADVIVTQLLCYHMPLLYFVCNHLIWFINHGALYNHALCVVVIGIVVVIGVIFTHRNFIFGMNMPLVYAHQIFSDSNSF